MSDTETHELDRGLTWVALLARWTEFARSALALPEHGDAGRVRQSVVAIITLQAVAHAVSEIDSLEREEQALGLDRAEILIRQHTGEIHSVWRAEPMPPEIDALIRDARAALSTARSRGVEWRLAEDRFVARHPGDLLVALAGNAIDLYLPSPGAAMFRTSPVAFARVTGGGDPPGDVLSMIESFIAVTLERRGGVVPRQVYRQFDFAAGGPVRDVVMAMEGVDEGESGSVPAGQPLLVPAMLAGDPQAVPLPLRSTGKKLAPLPVVFEG